MNASPSKSRTNGFAWAHPWIRWSSWHSAFPESIRCVFSERTAKPRTWRNSRKPPAWPSKRLMHWRRGRVQSPHRERLSRLIQVRLTSREWSARP